MHPNRQLVDIYGHLDVADKKIFDLHHEIEALNKQVKTKQELLDSLSSHKAELLAQAEVMTKKGKNVGNS